MAWWPKRKLSVETQEQVGDWATADLLADPLASAFFRARESEAHYKSLMLVADRAAYHGQLRTDLLSVIKLAEGRNVEALDLLISRSSEEARREERRLDDDPVQRVARMEPDGMRLLGGHKCKDLRGLSAGYQVASASASGSRRRALNHAYVQLHRILVEEGETGSFGVRRVSGARTYFWDVRRLLFRMALHDWDLLEAIAELQLLASDKAPWAEGQGYRAVELIEPTCKLAARLYAAQRPEEAQQALVVARAGLEVARGRGLNYDPLVKRAAETVGGMRKPQFVLNSVTQVENAFRLSAIDEKRRDANLARIESQGEKMTSKAPPVPHTSALMTTGGPSPARLGSTNLTATRFSGDAATNEVLYQVVADLRCLLETATPRNSTYAPIHLPQIQPFLDGMERTVKANSENQTIVSCCMHWGADACLLEGDRERAWDIFRRSRSLTLSDVVNRLPADCRLTADDILALLRSASRLTPFAREHMEGIVGALDVSLTDYYDEHGTDPITRVHRMFDYNRISEADFESIETLYERPRTFEILTRAHIADRTRRAEVAQRYDLRPNQYDMYAASYLPFPGTSLRVPQVRPWVHIPTLIQGAMNDEGRRLLRTAENLMREEKGLPNVGEGWIRETELFHRVKGEWPSLRVIHHGRPSWLGRQHLDIWMPDANVALEYQGLQHNLAVAFFGGEEAFRQAKRRDQQKAKLCEENGCTLVCVQEGYVWERIRDDIRSAIDSQ